MRWNQIRGRHQAELAGTGGEETPSRHGGPGQGPLSGARGHCLIGRKARGQNCGARPRGPTVDCLRRGVRRTVPQRPEHPQLSIDHCVRDHRVLARLRFVSRFLTKDSCPVEMGASARPPGSAHALRWLTRRPGSSLSFLGLGSAANYRCRWRRVRSVSELRCVGRAAAGADGAPSRR
jgi:hypothetical protein